MEDFNDRRKLLWQQFSTDSKARHSPSGGTNIFLFVLLPLFDWLTAEKLMKFFFQGTRNICHALILAKTSAPLLASIQVKPRLAGAWPCGKRDAICFARSGTPPYLRYRARNQIQLYRGCPKPL